MSSHGLLLRLFLSPSFFTVNVALQYLSIYSENIGISYYITRRLRELDIQILRNVWGFVCHLLITTAASSKSRAVEAFVEETCRRSTHIAMLTLWFMQASLRDLATSDHNSESFRTCHRVLHHCHDIIFSDLPSPVTAPYTGMSLPFQSRFGRKKVKPNVTPALVGIGLVISAVPALPLLTNVMGEVVLEQGRVEEISDRRDAESDLAPPASSPAKEDDLEDRHDFQQLSTDQPSTPILTNEAPSSDHRSVSASQTAPALPLHLRTVKRPRLSEDPLGQLDLESIPTPYQSSPSLSSSRSQTLHSPSLSVADALLQRYDFASQTHLLRSHYCRSEVQFLLSLEAISNRLLVVPKPARVSALRAELTVLNHKLPAEVCMPMWCASTDQPDASGSTLPHHKIVRIPPGESVVLNSAERAPYLLLLEILHGDLDFDPSKRANKDILRKVVAQKDQWKSASQDRIPFHAGSLPISLTSDRPDDADVVGGETVQTPDTLTPSQSLSASLDEDEEMDLVEQLYGDNQTFRSRTMDLSDSVVLPAAPRNKDLDMAAWTSIPPSPSLDQGGRSPVPQANGHHKGKASEHGISLDEYAERMRTAAIMLAQLNVNQSSRSAPGQNTRQGSSWLSVNHERVASVPGSSKENPNSQHMGSSRLNPVEAEAIKERIMKEMLALEEERMERMRDNPKSGLFSTSKLGSSSRAEEDEGIIRRELDKADPSAVVFSESWASKKSRIRHSSPYGHLANWDCVSVIVKTGGDLRQEQLAVQLIREFQRIWEDEGCACWVRHFDILILGGTSGLVETITDAVSIHSIKKAEYARRLAQGNLGHVTLLDHFRNTYGDPSSAKFARAQRNFVKSLAGYSIITYLLQVKDRHNGNILLDREGHLIHIDFGFILSNTPGNIGFEAAPFKLPPEYIDIMGGIDNAHYAEFRRLFRAGFEAARKHCDRIINLVELMQKDSSLPCFAAFGEQTASHLRDRFQPTLNHSMVEDFVGRLIDTSLGSNWTRLYDSYQYYSHSIL